MDETKYELPAWLPWATTACLAVMVACLFEFWTIEKSRSELLSEQGLLAESAAKAWQNQIEAERIIPCTRNGRPGLRRPTLSRGSR